MDVLFFSACGILLLIVSGWIYRALRLLRTLLLGPRLHPFTKQLASDHPFVSVIVPAKNEERNIRSCVQKLLAQDYPHFELIVVNDNSTDQTEALLKALGVDYDNAQPTPDGWTGKNFAIHTGVAKTKGTWLLFTDADTRHEKNSLSTAMDYVHSEGVQLLTLLPRCLTGGFLEDVIQPLAMAMLGLWFPLEKINDPNSPLHFANGQYLLMNRTLYEKIGGHKSVCGEFLEDFALMKKAKELKAPVRCALGMEIYGTRMYDSLAAIWRGWRRIYLHAYQSRPLSLTFKAVNVFVFSVAPFLSLGFLTFLPEFRTAYPFLYPLNWGILIFILGISWGGYGILKANKAYILFHPLAGLIISLILADAAWKGLTKQKTLWR